MMMLAIYLCYYFALSSQCVAERLCLFSDTKGQALQSCGECDDEQSPRSFNKGVLCVCSSFPAAVPVSGPSQGVGAGLIPAGPSCSLPCFQSCAVPCWAQFGEFLALFSLCRPWAVCCTSCATSPCPLGRARWPFVMATSPFQTTPGTPRTCTASSVSV